MVPADELEGYPKRTSKLRFALYAVAALALIGGAIYGIVAEAPGDRAAAAPEFSLVSLSGETITSQDLRGTPVVLNFWASWCYPCREEAPLLERMWQRYRSEGVRFIGINIRDHEADARRFVKRYGITFPTLRDPDQELARQLGIGIGLPQTFFITTDWRLASRAAGDELETLGDRRYLGAITEEELIANIEALLEGS